MTAPVRRRILVAVHAVELGGSQLNALDLATAVRDRGHDVALFAAPTGADAPLLELAAERGLPVMLAPVGASEGEVVAALAQAAAAHRADLVHAHEFPMAMRAAAGAYRRLGVPLVISVMAMSVPRWLPRTVPLLVGTEQLRRRSAASRPGPVQLLEPPVDTAYDAPGVVDPLRFRRAHGIPAQAPLVVVVSRLVADMKLEGIELTLAAVERTTVPGATFAVVGDGPARARIQARADQVNRLLGRTAVLLTGGMVDPRPAYAAADVVVGMGGSALRAMAFARPVVVLGVDGFWRPCTPQTVDHFLDEGFFGAGSGPADPAELAELLDRWLRDAAVRAALGDFGRQLVTSRFSLARAAGLALEVYDRAVLRCPPQLVRVGEYGRSYLHRAAADRLGPQTRRRVRGLLELRRVS